MKYTSLLFFLLFLSACSEDPQKISILNESEFNVSDKLVMVSKDQLQTIAGHLPVIKSQAGERVPTQLIDTDKDGDWDELVFQVSLESQGTSDFTLEWVVENDYPEFTKQTQVHLGYSEAKDGDYVSVEQSKRDSTHVPEDSPYTYQFEGPGWESNRVAFRSYFDTRNGKDIFGKTTEKMIMSEIGTGEDYHQLQKWGMDILKVGESLGSGALAILKKDSLIRLGKTESAEFKKVEEGPIFSSFKLMYKGWDVLGQEYELEEHISIQANKRWFQSEVLLRSPESLTDTLVVGIVNLKDANQRSLNHANMQALFTHGDQSEHKDALGMALLIPDQHYSGVSQAPVSGEGVTNSELLYLKPSGGFYNYYFYAGWEMEHQEFSKEEYFRDRLRDTMQELSVELKVSVK